MKFRQVLFSAAYVLFLVILFLFTQMITRWAAGAKVQAAAEPFAMTWIMPTASVDHDSALEQEEILLPTMAALLQITPTVVMESGATGTAAPVVQEATPAPTPPATDEPIIPKPGGTCISGAVIDHYHQAQGAGWEVTVTSGDNIQTAKVNQDGRFEIRGMAGGVWTVKLSLPEGWQPFTPDNFEVTLSGNGSNCAVVRFKVEPPGCIDILKVDQNGPQPQIGLPGWVFIGVHESGLQREGTTNGLGQVRFEGLSPGKWTFREQPQTGWIPAEGENDTKTITLVPPRQLNQCEQLKFVNRQLHSSCLTVQKKDDQGNPAPNWRIILTRDDGAWPSQDGQTDANGQVTFQNLPLGLWTVTEQLQEGWISDGSSSRRVNLAQPSLVCQVETFRNIRTTCIEGYKINHLEMGLPGWIIYAVNQATAETRQTVTDNNGFFRFDNLIRGTWVISEEQRTDWTPVTPSEFSIAAVEPRTPGQCYQVRFKNRFPHSCLEVYKVDAHDRAGLPGWNITLQPAYGGNSITKATDGIGHVRFEQLPPGEYIVSEETKPGWFPITEQSRQITLEASGICEVVTFENCQEISNAESGRCAR